MVEVSDKKFALKNWDGHSSGLQGNIRIKGNGWRGENYVGGLKNDMGFELMEDGTYSIHIDRGGTYSQAWEDKFMQLYGREVVKKVCKNTNLFLEEEHEENGELYLTLSSQF